MNDSHSSASPFYRPRDIKNILNNATNVFGGKEKLVSSEIFHVKVGNLQRKRIKSLQHIKHVSVRSVGLHNRFIDTKSS